MPSNHDLASRIAAPVWALTWVLTFGRLGRALFQLTPPPLPPKRYPTRPPPPPAPPPKKVDERRRVMWRTSSGAYLHPHGAPFTHPDCQAGCAPGDLAVCILCAKYDPVGQRIRRR